ncbi:MAG TPA: hypothetical protein VK255_00705 [Patescibacteria group bacterium]|nr:hypothetical protein [Patescibacteria group bacterium]
MKEMISLGVCSDGKCRSDNYLHSLINDENRGVIMEVRCSKCERAKNIALRAKCPSCGTMLLPMIEDGCFHLKCLRDDCGLTDREILSAAVITEIRLRDMWSIVPNSSEARIH